jgi:hypothetical protein
MRHAFFSAATAVAAALALGIHFSGPHDPVGFLTIMVGYPGFAVLSASDLENREAEVVFTVVNWLFYFVGLGPAARESS